MHRSIRVLLSSILLMAALGRADAGEIRLYGAGSLKEVMGELSSSYARTKGSAFTMQFGPSGLMRERIERGENVDVFASADMGHPLKLLRDARASMVVFFTRNLLCHIMPIKHCNIMIFV
ncbi:extracellular solute-binding protein [Rhizobiales bacterium GAS113]|nr:extracellular solute-binding protein [Rhizobiales bacterium GAS113]